MTLVPDIVRLSELDTQFSSDPLYTKHVYYISTPGRRADRQEERWQRQEELGRGAFGAVYLEVCVFGNKRGDVRAVKKFQKSKESNYHKELEAIGLFSHPK
ncbi:hypothetical protein LTS12_027161, partial [Elasticomyces elasticus]